MHQRGAPPRRAPGPYSDAGGLAPSEGHFPELSRSPSLDQQPLRVS